MLIASGLAPKQDWTRRMAAIAAQLKVELEVETDARELEIELKW